LGESWTHWAFRSAELPLQLNGRVMTGLWGSEDLGGKGGRVGPSKIGTIDTYGVHYSDMPSHISSGLDIHSITSPPRHILYSVETSKNITAFNQYILPASGPCTEWGNIKIPIFAGNQPIRTSNCAGYRAFSK